LSNARQINDNGQKKKINQNRPVGLLGLVLLEGK